MPKHADKDKETTPSALVRTSSTDTTAMLETLNACFDADSADGLGEVAPTDLRTPLKLYNLKKADGVQRISQDQFLDTLDRSVSDELNLVLLDLHKTNLYAVYAKKEDRNVTMCSSFDRVTGIWAEDNHARQCKGCPDAQWRTDEEGKRVVNCSEVWNVGAFCLDTQRVVLIKFKKTSLDAIRTYVQAHHIGRRPMPGGKRGNIPLCVYKVRVGIKMSANGNYAVPFLERGDMLSAADMRVMAETAAALRETFEARMRASEDPGDGAPPESGDTSFDPSTFNNGAQRGAEAFVE